MLYLAGDPTRTRSHTHRHIKGTQTSLPKCKLSYKSYQFSILISTVVNLIMLCAKFHILFKFMNCLSLDLHASRWYKITLWVDGKPLGTLSPAPPPTQSKLNGRQTAGDCLL